MTPRDADVRMWMATAYLRPYAWYWEMYMRGILPLPPFTRNTHS